MLSAAASYRIKPVWQ